ncbi:RNA polymerase II subunit A C-terminal domain phosphatase [Asbolus verrucosus]|uniref:RNA polymerase II subunit A C-terminal domain phosphatase n=1 Tax=Asbolus verrucosus TaxID=1661398 RepID=A0A482VMT1_ASBVE|nr:RNA polymerase II subunit A C-terminal domain phosphatase [Asbolus verrucosus]
MVCIIDDREDVWSNASNLIHVKPYHFFQHTGDINAPPGLDKHENDNKAGVDLTKLQEKKKNEKAPNKISEQNEQNKDDKCDTVTESKNEAVVNDQNSPNIVEGDKLEENNLNGETVKSDKDKCDRTEDKILVNKVDSRQETEKKKEINEQQKNENDIKSRENNLIEIEDSDDYLLHLEDILKRIHEAFYEDYDKMESGEVPDLKKVIPMVRGRVLRGCKLVFSGLVPTHIKLEQSKAYQIAKSLGAEVSQELEEDSTHLVAVRPGTAKVNAGRRKKNLKIVTPDWLWSCAERWEHVSEKIFPLNSKGSKNRHPPPHCSSPEHIVSYPEHNTPALRKRTPSGRFMDTINPLMSFSSADIADMDKEVEDILDDESDSSEDETPAKVKVAALKGNEENTSSSSSEDSLTAEYPKGYKRKREENNLINDLNNSTEDDESPSIKFRRGELVDSELDLEQDSQESEGSVEAPDEVDDGEWNMMGAALEREFLSNN